MKQETKFHASFHNNTHAVFFFTQYHYKNMHTTFFIPYTHTPDIAETQKFLKF